VVNTVLFVSPSLKGGGAERIILWLSKEYVKAGYSVHLVTVAGKSEDAYEIPSSIKRVALDLDSTSSGTFSAIFSNLRRVRGIQHQINLVDPDLIVSFLTSANIVSLLASKFSIRSRKIPVVISERSYSAGDKLSKFWSLLRRISYPLANEIVVLSEENREWILNQGLGKKVCIVKNPIVYPIPKVSPTLEPSDFFPSNCKIVLAVGRLIPQKGFDNLIEAFSLLESENPDWKLVILGEGDEKWMMRIIEDKKLNSRVLLPGRAGNVGDWYERANLFVLSSRREGFPNALVEAMASGLPVIATDCQTGPREIISNNENGVLVPVDDSRALANRMSMLMADPVLRERLSANAEDVRHQYSPDTIFKRWESVTKNYMSGR